jgi:hypothetical protein
LRQVVLTAAERGVALRAVTFAAREIGGEVGLVGDTLIEVVEALVAIAGTDRERRSAGGAVALTLAERAVAGVAVGLAGGEIAVALRGVREAQREIRLAHEQRIRGRGAKGAEEDLGPNAAELHGRHQHQPPLSQRGLRAQRRYHCWIASWFSAKRPLSSRT